MAREEGGLLADGAIVMVVFLVIILALGRLIGWSAVVQLYKDLMSLVHHLR